MGRVAAPSMQLAACPSHYDGSGTLDRGGTTSVVVTEAQPWWSPWSPKTDATARGARRRGATARPYGGSEGQGVRGEPGTRTPGASFGLLRARPPVRCHQRGHRGQLGAHCPRFLGRERRKTSSPRHWMRFFFGRFCFFIACRSGFPPGGGSGSRSGSRTRRCAKGGGSLGRSPSAARTRRGATTCGARGRFARE